MLYLLSMLIISCTEPQLIEEPQLQQNTIDTIKSAEISDPPKLTALGDDSINIFPSDGWAVVNSANLIPSTDFSYLTINANPGLINTGIRKVLPIDFGVYRQVVLKVDIDTISTRFSTGYYTDASPFTIDLFKASTLTANSTFLKKGLNTIVLQKKINYEDGWSGIQIMNYQLNNAYPKFIRIKSVYILGTRL
jgi:hypothetical protein